jgi:hypothetical protein
MMYDLMIFSQKLMATPAGNGKNAAPTFEFPVPVAP